MKKFRTNHMISETAIDNPFHDFDVAVPQTEKARKMKTFRFSQDSRQPNLQQISSLQMQKIRPKLSQPSTMYVSPSRNTSIQKSRNNCDKIRRYQTTRADDTDFRDLRKYLTCQEDVFPFLSQPNLLMQQHEKLVSNIKILPQSSKIQLFNNNYEVQKAIENPQNSPDLDNKLFFTMFNTLSQLDRDVINPLFSQGNPVLNYKIKFLSDSVEHSSELITMIIKMACKLDTKLSIFLENFWKYWVLIIDLTMQWLNKSCSDYIEFQVQSFKQQFQEAVRQKNNIEEKLINMERDYKQRILTHQRNEENLNQQILSITQDFNDYKLAIKEMSDLKQAEVRMKSVGLRALELENIFKQYDKSLQQSKIGFQKDFKELGKALIEQKKQTQNITPLYLNAQDHLLCHKAIEDETISVFMSIHPFVMCVDQCQDVEINQLELLRQFIEYLANLEEINDNICKLFKQWLNDPDQGNCILKYILDKESSDIPLAEAFCIFFGMKDFKQISHISVKQIINYYKQLAQENEIKINDTVTVKEYITYLELLLPEQFMEKFNTQMTKSTFTLEDLIMLLAKYYHNIENKKWTLWISDLQIQSEELDQCQINNYIELKKQINHGELSKQQQQESLNQIRHLSVLHPQLFYKPKQKSPLAKIQLAVRRVSQNKLSQRASPIKRQSTYRSSKKL